MFYTVNTKIKAMRATLLTARDYENLCAKDGNGVVLIKTEHDFAKISAYLDKPARDFLGKSYLHALCSDGAKAFSISPLCDKSGRESLKRVFGTDADLRNILWVYRLKKYHGINGSAVYSYLNPSNYKLSAEEISKLVHAKDMAHFSQIVANSFYGGIFKSLSDFTEQNLTRAVRSQFKKEARHENIAVICGYLYARHLEIKNIRAIAEGKKHGFSPQEIFSLLHI